MFDFSASWHAAPLTVDETVVVGVYVGHPVHKRSEATLRQSLGTQASLRFLELSLEALNESLVRGCAGFARCEVGWIIDDEDLASHPWFRGRWVISCPRTESVAHVYCAGWHALQQKGEIGLLIGMLSVPHLGTENIRAAVELAASGYYVLKPSQHDRLILAAARTSDLPLYIWHDVAGTEQVRLLRERLIHLGHVYEMDGSDEVAVLDDLFSFVNSQAAHQSDTTPGQNKLRDWCFDISLQH